MWTRLRRESPVHRFEPEDYAPFWALTKHTDIIEVSKQPDLYRSAGRFILMPEKLSDDELDALIDTVLTGNGFSSMADMGQAMKAVNAEVAGRAEGRVVADKVKAALGS